MYSTLPYSGQWYIGNQLGIPVNPNGVTAHLQQSLWITYLSERDNYRRARGATPKWVDDSSMRHAASVYDLKIASESSAATKVRIIYDKGFHGGNRAKDDKLSLIDRLQAQACTLCRSPDSQDHWLHSCSHPTLATLRTTIITDLNKKLTEYRDLGPLHRQIGAAYRNLLLTTAEPARIWTSNWSTAQINQFCSSVSSSLLQDMKMTELEQIIRPLEIILATGASGLWRCKQVHEHLLGVKPHSQRSAAPAARSCMGSTSKTASTTPSTLPRRRLRITPLLTTGSPTAINSCR